MVRSSIGKKAIVAVTGMGLFLFVIIHMIGNLQFFLGREVINHYGEFLHSWPEVLWMARLGLLALVVIHILVTIQLWRHNRAARPVAYAFEATVRASVASRWMIWTGLMVLAFIVYHLLHFTAFVTNPEYAQLYENLSSGEVVTLPGEDLAKITVVREHRRDVYGMLVAGFRDPVIAAVYIVAQLLLALHLSHGASSMFQTLGWNTPKHEPILRRVGPVGAAIVCAGFISLPIAIQFDRYTGLFGFGG